jgi:hypothetical protein
MRTLLLGLALLVAATSTPALAKAAKGGSGAAKKSGKAGAPAADPNEAVGKAHGGRVWIVTGTPPSVEGEDLNKWLSSHPSATEVTKKPNEERWPITFLAVFKKAPAKGPITVEFVDKKDPGTLVDQFSPPTVAESVVFQEPYDLETNNGFNKGHTYILKVGQIIKKKFVSYASAEISLK